MSELLAALPEKRVIGEPPRSVSSIAGDSRRVEPGACFVAVPGFKQDGRHFIPDAIRRGAAVVVTEGDPVADLPVAQVLVPSVRVSLARLAGAFYGHPSRQLSLVGITGTNGKTTTSYLVEAVLRARGLATGVIGTIGYVARRRDAPGQPDDAGGGRICNRCSRTCATAASGGVAMEVSSHALALARADGIAFDVAIFTNLTQDHLDFHGTLERYRRAKRRLFELLAASPKPRARRWSTRTIRPGPRWWRALDLNVLTFGLGARARGSAPSRTSRRSTASACTRRDARAAA